MSDTPIKRHASAARPVRATSQLTCLPAEVIERMLMALDHPRDLAAANAVSRLFRGAPGGRSPVEHALRERARARGHARALPPTLPVGACTWTEELFDRERVLELARAHANVVAAGGVDKAGCFSAFVDAEGGLHTCGEEEEVDDDGNMTGAYVPPIVIGHSDLTAIRVPTSVASLSAVRVRSVAAGKHHLLALSDAGTVYGCGENRYGQLGLGDDDERRAFAHIQALESEAIVGIAAGFYHSLALAAAGCAYSWGGNYWGQLGHGDKKERWEPTRVEALDGVRACGLCAGWQHTLLLSSSGAVYSCGSDLAGRLGHGDQEAQHTPRRIEALAGVRAVHVSAGSYHSLVVDSEGAVYSCGYGLSGRLGHGDTLFELAPRRVDALAGVLAVRACARADSSGVVGADGSVHTFGDNWHGQLGRPGVDELQLPTRVHALASARVTRCSLGVAHGLYVTADGGVYSCGLQSAALGHGVSMAAEAGLLRTPMRIEQLPHVQPFGIGERAALAS